MKREIRNAITKAIKESDLNGYKWSITENGLLWSYGVEFTFDTESENEMLIIKDKNGFVSVAIWYGDDEYADCKTLTEAFYKATKRAIRRANNVY